MIYIYSDGFDPENPLRAKGRNSITGVYMYILNIEEHLRGRLENFLVVQIIKSCDISEFGLEKCFERLTKDLNELVKNGIDVPGLNMAYPVRVAQYRGDNKGTSHLMHCFAYLGGVQPKPGFSI